MRFVCPMHGSQSVFLVSPDLHADPERLLRHCGVVDVIYEHQGQRVESYQLSSEFAREHGVSGGTHAIPDSYPEWQRLARAFCKKCLEQWGMSREI
jgi:hypothetical protein